MCTSQHCDHIKLFEDWTKENNPEGFTEVFTEWNDKEPGIDSIKSITSIKIPYPLPENLRLLHNAYEASLKRFPTNLLPTYDTKYTCIHGNPYSGENPITA